MIDKTVLSVPRQGGHRRAAKFTGVLGELLLVFAPILLLGTWGTILGGETLAGAGLITLAYGLSVILATIVLYARGSGWRQIGLAWPASWRRTLWLGVGAAVTTVVALLTARELEVLKLIASGLSTAT